MMVKNNTTYPNGRIYTLRTNGALKDLIGSFTLSQIQDLFGSSGDPYRGCLEGPPCYGALKHPKVLQSTPHKVLGSTPHLLLWDTLSSLLGASELFIL